MSTRPETPTNSRTGFENKKLRTDRLHFEHSTIEFEVGPVGAYAKIRRDGRAECAGPLDEETIDALYRVGEREVWVGRDPHGVVSDEFKREYDGLRHANRQMQSDTPESEKKRCPECEHTAITPLSDGATSNVDENWKCKHRGCYVRFDDPLPPECEVEDDEKDGDRR